jgi:RHS repeat-associated protein
LRSAIDALRAHKGLPGYGWQAAAGVGDPVTINPITEMRAALNEALGAPSGGYSAGLAQWQPILAVHLQELRNRVLGAWQSGGSGVDLRWLVTDQLGTPRMVVDKTGSLAGVSRHDYLPFGEELYINVGGRTTTQGYGAADTVRQKFTGKERDSETGIDYFATRYYSSTQGRFTSPDSLYFAADRLADPQKFNLYGYVRNNPLNTIDPDGRDGVVVGQTPQDVDETVKYLKRIAPGTKVDADGTIHKPGFFRRLWNRVSGHGAGTALVSAIVDSNKTVAISAGRTILSGVLGNTGIPSSKLTDKSAAIFGVDKSKVDYVIAFDPSKSTPTALRQSDGTITEKDAAPEMVLAHELIHASQFLRGVKYDQTPADHVFQEAGKWHLEEVAKSELQTVGLAPGGNITENKIRRELGYLPRAAYFTRNQWSR